MRNIEIRWSSFRKMMNKLSRLSGVYVWMINKKCLYVGASVDCGYRATRVFWASLDDNKTTKRILRIVNNNGGKKKIKVFVFPFRRDELRMGENIIYRLLHPKTMDDCPLYYYKERNKRRSK